MLISISCPSCSDANGHIKLTDFGLCTGFRWTHNSKYYQNNGKILNGKFIICKPKHFSLSAQ